MSATTLAVVLSLVAGVAGLVLLAGGAALTVRR
jgi:hypothetical protein